MKKIERKSTIFFVFSKLGSNTVDEKLEDREGCN